MRLDKFLCDAHIGTRKDVKKLIKDGKVKVDGTLAKSFDMKIDEEKSVVTLNGEKVVYEKYVYFMMNKPQGYISATEDKYNNTVLNLLSDEYKNYNLFPAGRLDIDTEGFLLLTDDGVFAHNILSPKKHVSKTYFALIDGKVKDEHIKMFEDGITLEDGYKTLPAKLKILKSSDKSEIELTIYEGKFHQVKRMFEAIGSHVTYLKRIAMGNLFLDEKLPLGEIKKLNKDDILKIEADRYKGE
jgi:16S rRNA pseudouridine516 synthase